LPFEVGFEEVPVEEVDVATFQPMRATALISADLVTELVV
jgi:hypothetical protein